VNQHDTLPLKTLTLGLAIAFGILAGFVMVVLFVAQLGLKEHHGEAHETHQERLRPVGQVKVEGVVTPAVSTPVAVEKAPTPVAKAPVPIAKTPKSGKEIYESACVACHKDGILGAPKFGDNVAWAPRFAQGEATLFQNASKGMGAMPPRGGQSMLSDEELKDSIQYMLASAGFSPKAETPEATPSEETTAEPTEEDTLTEPPATSSEEVSTPPEAEPATPLEEVTAPEAEPVAASTELDLVKGEQVYTMACAMCHVTGLAGSPIFGDKAAWAPRIAKGMDALFTSALQGTSKGMPPKGGQIGMPDEDIKAAVAYMVSKAQ
jgi:cytochrome c5